MSIGVFTSLTETDKDFFYINSDVSPAGGAQGDHLQFMA